MGQALKTETSIAVIVPVFNEAQVLRESLQHFVDLKADELLFVDGGSSDNTLEILSQFGLNWISSTLGRAAQMNAGSKMLNSTILLFIHIDTALSESHLLTIKQLMSQSPKTVGGRFDVRLSGHHPAFRVIENMINMRSRLSKISTGDQAMFVRREVFEAMGGFADIPLLEDVEFSRRLKRIGQIACLHQQVVTSSRRWQLHGIVKTVWLMWKIRLLYWFNMSPQKLAILYRDAR